MRSTSQKSFQLESTSPTSYRGFHDMCAKLIVLPSWVWASAAGSSASRAESLISGPPLIARVQLSAAYFPGSPHTHFYGAHPQFRPLGIVSGPATAPHPRISYVGRGSAQG